MEIVDIDDIDGWMSPATIKRPVGKALGTENVALNYYELASGDSFAFGYHAHGNQEEVFYIVDGTVTFETEDGTVEVASGEAIRFAPGEFQRGFNDGDERVRAIAVGAPADAGELTLLRECETCGERTDQDIERADDADALVTLCVDCGEETGRFS
jgi:uncharacterized cupin superfamily protein